MKQNELLEEMIDTAKKLGILIRKDSGSFRGGYCIMKDKEIVVLNRSTPKETILSILSQTLIKYADEIYLKPAVREYIEKEAEKFVEEEKIVV